jgi:hypothetical protein
VNEETAIPLMLLALHGLALVIGATMLAWMITLHRRARAAESRIQSRPEFPPFQSTFAPRPASWMAIRSQSPKAVRTALGLDVFASEPWV